MARNLIVCILTLISIASTIGSSIAPANAGDDNSAKLTELNGKVFKRGFIDWKKELWADPQPAQLGDMLHEGMQVGTGDKSWAELKWPHVMTRAWANSVFAIAPNQRLVYLLGGEVLYQLDKHRRNKSEYCVWTKTIQARMRGTTVLVQSAGDLSRVTVLEGTIDVLNRVDGSVLRLSPGAVYEVKDKTLSSGKLDASVSGNASGKASLNGNASGTPTVSGNASANATSDVNIAAKADSLTKITNVQIPPLYLFETSKTLSFVSLVDTKALLGDPLLVGFASKPISQALIQTALKSVQSVFDETPPDSAERAKSIASFVQVLTPPKSLSYEIGPLIGSVIPLPPSANSLFPPTGIIGSANEGGKGLNELGLPGYSRKGMALPVSGNTSLPGNISPMSGGAGISSGINSGINTGINSSVFSTPSLPTTGGLNSLIPQTNGALNLPLGH